MCSLEKTAELWLLTAGDFQAVEGPPGCPWRPKNSLSSTLLTTAEYTVHWRAKRCYVKRDKVEIEWAAERANEYYTRWTDVSEDVKFKHVRAEQSEWDGHTGVVLPEWGVERAARRHGTHGWLTPVIPEREWLFRPSVVTWKWASRLSLQRSDDRTLKRAVAYMRQANAGGGLANPCENRAREIVTEGPRSERAR